MTVEEREKIKKELGKQKVWETYKDVLLSHAVTMLDLKLWPKQEAIMTSAAKIIVIMAGRNTAKSFNAALKCYQLLYFGALFDFPIHIKIAVPKAEDSIPIWDHLQSFLKKAPLEELFPEFNVIIRKNEATHKTELSASTDSWIRTASLQDKQATDMRGNWLDLAILEEFGQVPYPEEALNAVYGGATRDSRIALNRIYICGTPPRVPTEAFDNLFEKGQIGAKVESFQIEADDNPYKDTESLNLFQSLATSNAYQTEVLGHSTPVVGPLFPEFNPVIHIVPTNFNADHPLIVGIDSGFHKPAVIFIQYYHDTLKILKELSLKKIMANQLAKDIKATLTNYFYDIQPLVVGVDKASNSKDSKNPFTEFQIFKKKLPQATFSTNSALISKGNQVTVLRTLLKENKILIDPSCQKLIRAIGQATPDTSRNTDAIKTAGWRKIKGYDDPLDALCYALINYGPTSDLFYKQYQQPSKQLTEEQASYILSVLG